MPVTVVNPGLAPTFSKPVLVSVPLPKLMLPPLRMLPLLVSEALPLRLKLPPDWISIVPVLVANPIDEESVPLLATPVPARSVPLLVKVLPAPSMSMVKVAPVPLAWMVPKLTTETGL